MPDAREFMEVMLAAALAAAVLALLFAWPWRTAGSWRRSAACVLGVAVGFFVGVWQLGLWPRWPPREDQGRLVLVLFPAVVAVELVAPWLGRLRWLAWLLRLIIAASAAPVLLYGTYYLAANASAGGWSALQSSSILGGCAVALAGAWAALTLLARRKLGRSVSLALAVACGGASVTIMLSGYATGGQMGLPLAAALAGATFATLLLPKPPDMAGVLGVGVVGLSALLIMGKFFGQLATANAILLFVAPLLCWLPELWPFRRMGLRLAGVVRVGLAAAPVVVALMLAQQKFAEDSVQTSPGSGEPSLQDYMDYGK